VPRIALSYNIQLILWGENPAHQIGDQKTLGKNGWDGNSVRNMNTLRGGIPTWMISEGFKRKQILQYFYPDTYEIQKANIQLIYLGYFWKDWTPLDNANYSITNGLEVRSETGEKTGDPYGIGALDEDWVTLNQMIKYYKYGFGWTTESVNEEIRRGRLSRSDGIKIIEKYDGMCDDKYIESFCRYIEISKKAFWKNVERFVNKKLFRKSFNKWIKKFKVGISQ
jgi:hypothetical protein